MNEKYKTNLRKCLKEAELIHYENLFDHQKNRYIISGDLSIPS